MSNSGKRDTKVSGLFEKEGFRRRDGLVSEKMGKEGTYRAKEALQDKKDALSSLSSSSVCISGVQMGL